MRIIRLTSLVAGLLLCAGFFVGLSPAGAVTGTTAPQWCRGALFLGQALPTLPPNGTAPTPAQVQSILSALEPTINILTDAQPLAPTQGLRTELNTAVAKLNGEYSYLQTLPTGANATASDVSEADNLAAQARDWFNAAYSSSNNWCNQLREGHKVYVTGDGFTSCPLPNLSVWFRYSNGVVRRYDLTEHGPQAELTEDENGSSLPIWLKVNYDPGQRHTGITTNVALPNACVLLSAGSY